MSGHAGFLKSVFGEIEYVAIPSPKIEGRVRENYGSEIATLAGLGFNYRCCYAEAFSIFRLGLAIPALVILSMRLQGSVVHIGRGLKAMDCYPLPISGDDGTYAHASLNGVKLHTLFLDGTALVPAMNPRLDESAGPTMTRRCGAASIPELWSAHRQRIEAFESEGKQLDLHVSLQTYFRPQQREDARL